MRPIHLKVKYQCLYVKNSFDNLMEYKYKKRPGDYCEGVIPDPIPNSEVKPFSANGTLS